MAKSQSHGTSSKRPISPDASQNRSEASSKRSKISLDSDQPSKARDEVPLHEQSSSTTMVTQTGSLQSSQIQMASVVAESAPLKYTGLKSSTLSRPTPPPSESSHGTFAIPLRDTSAPKEALGVSLTAQADHQQLATAVSPPPITKQSLISKNVPSIPPTSTIPSDEFMDDDVPDPWLVHPGRHKLMLKRQAEAKAAAEAKVEKEERDRLLAKALTVQTKRRTAAAKDPVLPEASQTSSPGSSSKFQTKDDGNDVKPSSDTQKRAITLPASESRKTDDPDIKDALRSSTDGPSGKDSPSEPTVENPKKVKKRSAAFEQFLSRQMASSAPKPRGRRVNEDPEKVALALTKDLTYAQYISWIEERGPIRGGRRGSKFNDLVFFYLVQEGMGRKLGEVSRGRLDFVRLPTLSSSYPHLTVLPLSTIADEEWSETGERV